MNGSRALYRFRVPESNKIDPRTYLDHAATAPMLPEALAAMEQGFAAWANPSSPYASGRAARAMLEDARSRVKAALGWGGELVFTSGASEAIAIALTRRKAPLKAMTPVEHTAVLRWQDEAAVWPVGADGIVSDPPGDLGGLVAVQHVNNETGVIQPVDRVAEQVRAAGGVLFCDCAQSAGKLQLPEADMVAISAHKFGGPVGFGALLLREFGLIDAVGGQEHGYRAGTENLPAALGMAAALEAGNGWMSHAATLRARLEQAIAEAGGETVARETPRSPAIGAYRMPGVSAAAQLIRFDAAGFAVSAGSACSSGSLKPSHVLAAMGYPHPQEVIRVSIGRETTERDIDAFVEQWKGMAGQ